MEIQRDVLGNVKLQGISVGDLHLLMAVVL
jgi:hypothetical protein